MRIYVASSWRNAYQPGVVEMLRAAGHGVYDFRNPEPGNQGFHWSTIDPQWKEWTPEQYRNALTEGVAVSGYRLDYNAMERSECCVLVLPSGRSAHIEAGHMKGCGKRLVIFLPPGEPFEPELMYKVADRICISLAEVVQACRELD